MKTIELNGITNLRPVSGGTSEWYWSTDFTNGDLYEAEELFRDGNNVQGNSLYLISYPGGEVYQPIPRASNRYFGQPVYDNGTIAILMVDFAVSKIYILRFDPSVDGVSKIAQLPLSLVKDCYNLILHTSPLTLTRQPNDNSFEIIWPEASQFFVENTETLNFRDCNKLYFTSWYEDPDYREETIVRSYPDGEVLERFPGDILIMPNGDKWRIK